MNVWDVNEQIRDLIRSRRVVDAGRLTDPELPLAELVAEAAESQQ
jgi:3-phenylpropionate/trans-cinnamate dioxygenase ferredoxin reductase component